MKSLVSTAGTFEPFNVITKLASEYDCDGVKYPFSVVGNNCTIVDYVAQPNLAPIRAEKIAQVRAERDRRKFNGVQVQGKWIHTDTYSRTQWLGMVMMGAAIPQIAWTTMDGSTINTSQTLAGQVFQATAALDQALFAKAAALIAQIEASNDPATVDITTGWQATYGG